MNTKLDNTIYSLVEHRKSLWTTLIVVVSGIAGVFLTLTEFALNLTTMIKFSLISLGFIAVYFIACGINIVNRQIQTKLKEEK